MALGGFIKPINKMKEMYWIERLDNIQCVLIIALTWSVIWLLIVLIVHFMNDDENDSLDKERYRSRKIAGSIIAICTLILTFLSSTEEMYCIIGIGGTIDYLRQNETAKQLPDKCVKALDLFITKMTDESNNSQK